MVAAVPYLPRLRRPRPSPRPSPRLGLRPRHEKAAHRWRRRAAEFVSARATGVREERLVIPLFDDRRVNPRYPQGRRSPHPLAPTCAARLTGHLPQPHLRHDQLRPVAPHALGGTGRRAGSGTRGTSGALTGSIGRAGSTDRPPTFGRGADRSASSGSGCMAHGYYLGVEEPLMPLCVKSTCLTNKRVSIIKPSSFMLLQPSRRPVGLHGLAASA
jgi:hypothetical protein